MYGLIGKLRCVPGERETVLVILLAGTGAMPGCRSYVVARDPADPDALWITEVWESREAHQASLALPAVREAIAQAKPRIAGFGERFETEPVGGHGLVAPATRTKAAPRAGSAGGGKTAAALSDVEWKRCELDLADFLSRRRPPPHVRAQVDLTYRRVGSSVELLEVRPPWDGHGGPVERGLARFTFVRARNAWRLFWRRADGKWHAYRPHPEAASLRACLEVVERDDHACFFG